MPAQTRIDFGGACHENKGLQRVFETGWMRPVNRIGRFNQEVPVLISLDQGCENIEAVTIQRADLRLISKYLVISAIAQS
ncbi:hypothetical protein ACVDG5_014105 [Mesorhizobium sp. ORM6]